MTRRDSVSTPPINDHLPPTLPHSIETEQAAIGCALNDNSLVLMLADRLAGEDFYEPVHGRIWTSMTSRVARGEPANPLTMQQEFDGDPALTELGGAHYLSKLMQAAETIINPDHYCRMVVDLSLKRRLTLKLGELKDKAANGEDVTQVVLDLQSFAGSMGDHLQGRARGELVCAADLQGRAPERKWLAPSWVPWGEVTMLGGAGGVGKSLLAQQLGTSFATSKPWLGMDIADGPALIMGCEDSLDELHRRRDSIMDAMGLQEHHLRYLTLWPRRGKSNILMVYDDKGMGRLTPLFADLVDACRHTGARLVILDTLAHVYGGNESIRPQVTQFVSACLQNLADTIHGTVVICAHPSRSGLQDGSGLSGSTAWEGSVRSRLYFEKPKEEDADKDERVLRRMKANYAGGDDALQLVWKSGVICLPSSSPTLAGMDGQTTPTEAFVGLLRVAMKQDRVLSDKANVTNYAPKWMQRAARANGIKGLKTGHFERAMEELFASGRIRLVDFRMPNRHMTKIIELVGG